MLSERLEILEPNRSNETHSVVANFVTTAKDGKIYPVDYYNLDAIISVGYRMNSIQGTQFIIWATERLSNCLSRAR